MKFLLDRRLFNAEGDSGGAAPLAAGAAAADPAGSAAHAATPAPSGGAAPPAGELLAPAGDLYKPDGLAENFLGKTNNETIDKLRQAVDGYRNRDAQQQIPEKVDAYAEFAGDIPDTIKPHIETLKGDPLFGRVAEKALALRVPLPAYQGLVQEFVSVAHEMGMMEPIVDEKAERAALVPDAAKHLGEAEQKAAVERRMNENYAFMDALAERGPTNGGLAKDDVEFAKAMLGDSAKGHRVLELLRSAVSGGQGGGPAIIVPGNAGGDPKADLTRRSGLPENTWGNPKFNQASYNQLQADYQKFHGD